MSSSHLRIGGLASGMDIDSIVKDLMKAEREAADTNRRGLARVEA